MASLLSKVSSLLRADLLFLPADLLLTVRGTVSLPPEGRQVTSRREKVTEPLERVTEPKEKRGCPLKVLRYQVTPARRFDTAPRRLVTPASRFVTYRSSSGKFTVRRAVSDEMRTQK